MRFTPARLVPALMAVALLGAACNSNSTPNSSGSTTQPGSTQGSATSATAAAGLRSDLNMLLQEHVYLAAAATGAALGGRADEFDAAATALDANSDALIETFGSVYPDGEPTFSDAWKGHIGFVVDYTTGIAGGDQAKADQAVADLQGYWEAVGAFLSDTIPTLPDASAVSGLVMEHVLTLKEVIDAQHAGDAAAVFSGLRAAAGHMSMIGDALAEAIVQDNPDAFAS